MITIKNLKINNDSSKINVNVETVKDKKFTKVLLWDFKTFKDYTKAIDLSSLLTVAASRNNIETFEIVPSNINQTSFLGLFFLEFSDDNKQKKIGLVSNFIKYYECLLDKTLKIDLKNKNDDTFYLSTLLNTLNSTVKWGFYTEAISIIKTLEELCEICSTCPDYKNNKLVNGLGFGITDNSIVTV